MAGADSGTRQRLADAGQRLHGNAALQRVLAPGAVLPVQRRARSRLSAVRVTVAHRTRAAFTAAVRAEWSSWIAEHQSAQTAIDPCTATFDCPASAAAPEPAGLESARGARRGRA